MPFFKARDRRSKSLPAVIEENNNHVTVSRHVMPAISLTLGKSQRVHGRVSPEDGPSPGPAPGPKRSRLGSLVDRLSAPRRTSMPALCARRVKLDFLSGGRRDSYGGREEWELGFDHPNRNYSTDLVITDLRDGVFAADLPLAALPIGDVVIRVRSYKLLLTLKLLGSAAGLANSHRISRPYSFGYCELPIYVDTTTLEAAMATDGSDVIKLRAKMKGFIHSLNSPSMFNKDVLQKHKQLRKSVSSPLMHMRRRKTFTNAPEVDDRYDEMMRRARLRSNTR